MQMHQQAMNLILFKKSNDAPCSVRRTPKSTPAFLPGESPRTEDPDGLQSIESYRVRHDWTNCRKSNDAPSSSTLSLVCPVDQQALYETPAELDPQTCGRWSVKHLYPTLGSLNSEIQQDSVSKKEENVCFWSSQGWAKFPWHCDQARSLQLTPNRGRVQWSSPASSPLWKMLSYLFSASSRYYLVTKSWPALCWPHRL